MSDQFSLTILSEVVLVIQNYGISFIPPPLELCHFIFCLLVQNLFNKLQAGGGSYFC